MYDSPCPIMWDHTIFGVNNGGMQLYVYMNGIMKIAMGSQMLNITVIQLWMK